MRQVFVTTSDNPYDFFDQFNEWYAFDEVKGYRTCEYVARLCKTSDLDSDYEVTAQIEEAVDEICKLNLTGKYVKIERDVPDEYVEEGEGINVNKFFPES